MIVDLPREVHEHEVIQILLTVSGDGLEIFLRGFHEVHDGQAWARLPPCLDIGMQHHVAVPQVTNFEDRRDHVLRWLVVDQDLHLEQHLLQEDAVGSHANLLILFLVLEVVEIVFLDGITAAIRPPSLFPLVLRRRQIEY